MSKWAGKYATMHFSSDSEVDLVYNSIVSVAGAEENKQP